MKLFTKICKMKQYQLKNWLVRRYSGKGFEIHNGDGYLYFKPTNNPFPICLTAHMDTVHKDPVRQIQIEKHPGQTIISSPQGIGGDDRCGIYMIVKLLDKGMRPHVVFCEDEEVGCVGARKFSRTGLAKEMEVNFIVELDRRNAKDAVYYDLDSKEFENFITETTGYETAIGSYSDICEIAPSVGVAAVNLSCGYYKEHTLEHYVVWEEMMETLRATEKLVEASVSAKRFEYVETERLFNDFLYGYATLTFTWVENGELCIDYGDGNTVNEAIGMFMINHPDLCLNDVLYDIEEWI